MGSAWAKFGLRNGTYACHKPFYEEQESLFALFLLEIRDESTFSSSCCYYQNNVLSIQCPFHRVCCGGSAERKLGGTLVWAPCVVLPVHLKRYPPAHLLSTNQQVSFCFQTVPQRSSRIQRLQREASQLQKKPTKTKC